MVELIQFIAGIFEALLDRFFGNNQAQLKSKKKVIKKG